jgi:hypothetical protein
VRLAEVKVGGTSMMRAAIFAAVVLWATTGFAEAPTDQLPIARQLISLAVNPSTDYTRDGRVKLVQILANYCIAILELLPTNTPNEQAWVQTEGQTTDLTKVKRLVATKEYGRSSLKETFSDCEQKSKKLMQGLTGGPRSDTIARYEGASLVSLAINFNDDSVEMFATRLGMQPKALGFDFLASVRRALLFGALKALEDNK